MAIKLGTNQLDTIKKITEYAESYSYRYEENGVEYGPTRYLTQDQIEIAVQIAFKESSLNPDVGRANGDGDAIGLFQYQEKPWLERHAALGDRAVTNKTPILSIKRSFI